MPLYITNANDFTVTLLAPDGDKVLLPPKSREVPVHNKFNDELPRGVKIVRQEPDQFFVPPVEPTPEEPGE